MPPQEPRQPPADIPGQPSWIAPIRPVVPDHELLVRIGGGSYGDVWLARSVVGTWRAVKVVFRDRFLDARPYEREFSGIQKFEPLSRSNEGFVDVLQIGRNDAEGYFYYIMELADDAAQAKESDQCSVISSQSSIPESRQPPTTGRCSPSTGLNLETYVPKTLAKVMLQRGRLPVGECLELGITLNLALARLHAAGLIHRDIKPSNIIFVGGVPKLADIGLVIEFAEARSYVGTEGFIPPEGPNSPQADLYGLGKVLYEAGMGKDRKDFPEPPTLIAQVPDSAELLEFNAILLKACAANVKDRYQSAVEMNADLALLQSGGSVRRQRTLTRRLRSVQRAGVMVTALATVIGAGWLWQARQTHLVQQLADEKTRLVQEKTRLADSNRERLVRLNIANGVRLLDQDDFSGALLWFADTLPLVAGKPAEEAIHRIRIQQVLSQSPRLLRLMPHESSVLSGSFSPDGRRVATGTEEGWLRVWDIVAGKPLWESDEKLRLYDVRFTRDGRRLFVCCVRQQGLACAGAYSKQLVEVVDAETGKLVFPRVTTNLVSCAFSPDDRWVAIARTNNTIEVMDAADGRSVVELSGYTDEILMLAFSDDGSLVASANRDRTVRFWALPSGKPFGPTLEHEQPVQQVTFSSDRHWVATSTQGGEGDNFDPEELCMIQVWNVETGARVGPPHLERQRARAMFFSPGAEKKLFTGGEADGVRVWDVGTNAAAIRTLNIPTVRCWAFSPDGQNVGIGTDNGFAYIWSLESGDLLFPQFRHTGYLNSVQFSPDGSRLLTTSDDATAKVWDLTQKPESARLTLSSNLKKVDPSGIRFHRPTSGLLDLELEDGGLHLVDPEQLVEVKTLKANGKEPVNLAVEVGWSGRSWALVEAWSPETQGLPHTVTLWQKNGTEFGHLELSHPKALMGFAFYPDDTHLVTFAADHIARIWRSIDGKLMRSVPLPKSLHYFIPTSYEQWVRPDGKAYLMILDRDGKEYMQLVDLDTGEPMGKPFLGLQAWSLNKARFSPDGTRLAAVGSDQMGHIVDLQSGQLSVPNFKHGGSLGDLDWSPDGKLLITAGFSPEAKLWEAATGQPVLSPMSGVRSILAISWSADGRFIVTRDEGNNVRVWDAATTEAVTPRLHHSGYVRYAFMRGGSRLTTASDPNLLRAWDLTETKLDAEVIADYAHLLAGRKINASGVLLPLTPAELERLQGSLQDRAPALFSTP